VRLGCCLPIGVTRPEACEEMGENREQKKWREVEEQEQRRLVMPCNDGGDARRPVKKERESRNSMREREKGKEAIIVLYPPYRDKAFSVSCNGVESYPCYCWYGRSCSFIVSTCAVYTFIT